MPIDLAALREAATPRNQYERQLSRLRTQGVSTAQIEQAVSGVLSKVAAARSIVVYGDPQSGKTEMMICLTAQLLDTGRSMIVHLLNDNVDLLSQNLQRFQQSGLAPAPLAGGTLPATITPSGPHIFFCKKNSRDLQRLNDLISGSEEVTVVDDEADFATPNGRINRGEVTRINQLVDRLVGPTGTYIGVTATPARLDLNNTLATQAVDWVHFPSHHAYTGPDVFFPVDFDHQALQFRLTFVQSGSDTELRAAIRRFLGTSAHRNLNGPETAYSMLIHTSGSTADHTADEAVVRNLLDVLGNPSDPAFNDEAEALYNDVTRMYGDALALGICEYVLQNIRRSVAMTLNSQRDRRVGGDQPTVPTSPFFFVIGGNVISRGVTFPNLLSMYFTRDTRTRIQQDTYIQRARMFGARGPYLSDFELCIPQTLYSEWHQSFVFQRLSLVTL